MDAPPASRILLAAPSTSEPDEEDYPDDHPEPEVSLKAGQRAPNPGRRARPHRNACQLRGLTGQWTHVSRACPADGRAVAWSPWSHRSDVDSMQDDQGAVTPGPVVAGRRFDHDPRIGSERRSPPVHRQGRSLGIGEVATRPNASRVLRHSSVVAAVSCPNWLSRRARKRSLWVGSGCLRSMVMGVRCLAVRRDKAVGPTGSARRLTQQRAASPGLFRTWATCGTGQGFTEAAARAVRCASHSGSINPVVRARPMASRTRPSSIREP